MIVIKDARGTVIEDGDSVETNELKVGVVNDVDRRSPAEAGSWSGWFTVRYPDGREVLQNGARVLLVRKATLFSKAA